MHSRIELVRAIGKCNQRASSYEPVALPLSYRPSATRRTTSFPGIRKLSTGFVEVQKWALTIAERMDLETASEI